jgi:Protein of unknown function (DUF1579)
MDKTLKHALGLFAGLVLLSNLATSQDPGTPDAADAMKKWMEAATPGEQHKALGKWIGKWDVEMAVTGMGGAPMKSKGEAEIRWLLEGRFTITETNASMIGMPFHSFVVYGYDNFKKKYVAMAVDSMNTQLLTFSGRASPDGKLMEMYGPMDEPMTGEVGKWVKYVTRVTSDDSFVVEVHDLAIVGGDAKVVEMTYTRRKG